MNRKFQNIVYLALLIIISAAFYLLAKKTDVFNFSGSGLNQYFNSRWAQDKLWDDGLAEVAVYESQRIVYGEQRYFDYMYILVKETFNREFNVKTDDYGRNDLFDVMKVNKFARIETHKYPYHYLTSIFFKRNDPGHVHKFTNSSQEWCGNTFKHIDHENDKYVYHFDSYWDTQGRGSMDLPANILYEDQLSYSLRTLKFRENMSFDWKVVESQITNKADEPVIYDASFFVSKSRIEPGSPEVPAEIPAWKVLVSLGGEKNNTYWFEVEYPNVMLKMEAWDGRKMILTSIKRYDYWDAE